MSKINIEINGKNIEAEAGQMIIEVADRENVRIPRFCYHKNLSVAANCRMCLVEVDKARKPVPACATPVTDGMKVFTRSAETLKAQKAVMEFLLINHPLDCPVCDQGGECELQDVSMGYGEDLSRYNEGKRSVDGQDIGPLIETYMTRCIACTRCVRFGEEISGMRELGAVGRGEFTEISTFVKKHVNSELSGNVIDLCPVGALVDKPYHYSARTWEMKQHASVSPHDCMGSNIFVHERRQERKRVVPRENDAINETWIADRDRYSIKGLDSNDRVTQPMMKVNGEWQTTDWTTALEHTVANLQKVIHKQGEGAIAGLASANDTMENLYLFQEWLRGLGVKHIDHRAKQQDFTDQEAFPTYPNLGTTFANLEKVDAALLVGSHTRKEQPMAWHRLHKAWKNGSKISWVNVADYDMIITPHAKVIPDHGDLVMGLAGVFKLLGNSASLPKALTNLLDNVEVTAAHKHMLESLKTSTNGAVVLGVAAMNHPQAATLRFMANEIAKATSSTFGFLTEGGNAAGAWLTGVLPHRKAGGAAINNPGFDAKAMFEDPRHAYVLLNVEPEYDCANTGQAVKALNKADFVVAINAFHTPAMLGYCDVILPAAPFTEVSGTFVNAQGDWQRVNASVPPMGEARPAWKIFRVLGNLCQLENFDKYITIADVYQAIEKEAGERTPAAAQWPAPEFAAQPKAGFIRLAETPLYAVDAITRRSAPLQATFDAQFPQGAHINAALAEQIGVKAEDKVSVMQDDMSVELDVVIDDRIPPNCIFVAQGLTAHATLGAGYQPIEIKRV